MGDADEALATGDLDGALAVYADSVARLPQHHEIPFWHAVVLAGLGRDDEARAAAAPVFARADGERWRELVRRLPATGVLPDDAAADAARRRLDVAAELDGVGHPLDADGVGRLAQADLVLVGEGLGEPVGAAASCRGAR